MKHEKKKHARQKRKLNNMNHLIFLRQQNIMEIENPRIKRINILSYSKGYIIRSRFLQTSARMHGFP